MAAAKNVFCSIYITKCTVKCKAMCAKNVPTVLCANIVVTVQNTPSEC